MVSTLPVDWTVVSLGELARPIRARVSPRQADGLRFVGMEHIQPHTMRLLGSVPASTMKSAAVRFEPGDVLYGRLRPYLNKVYRPDFAGLGSAEFIVLTPSQQLSARFLVHVLNSSDFVRFASALNTGDRPRVDFDQIARYQMPLPPLDEQERIADILDSQMSRLLTAEGLLVTVRKKLRVLTSAILDQAVKRGRAAGAAHVLGDLAEVQGGIQKQPKRRPVAHHYPFLRVANVLRRSLDLSDIHRIELFGDELDRYRLLSGDLLIVEGNGSPSQIGRMAVWDASIEDCVHQNHIIRARPGSALLPEWAEVVWNSPVGMAAVRQVASSTSGLYTLSAEKVKRLPVVVPPLADQRAILNDVRAAVSLVDAMETEAKTSHSRAEALKQALHATVLTGQSGSNH